jgi:hypothetical protein
MMQARPNFYYDVHGLLTVASQVALADLAYFQTPAAPERVDLQLRVDRHGTPSRIPGAICYDEHLGRFGFGLTVMPGDFTEIVVSPLLESSPAFLYTNVVEPVLHWLLLTRGYSLARAAGVRPATGGEAMLITGRPDLSDGLSRLCAGGPYDFMGDDRIIIGRDRRVYSFPKPVTASRQTRPGGARATPALRLQRLLYSRPVRGLGLFLGRRRLPAATLNTYLQRFIPQPKFPFDVVVPGAGYADRATPAALIFQEKGDGRLTALPLEATIDRLLEAGDQALGFRPYPLLLDALGQWGGDDWVEEERAILRAGLAGCRTLHWRYGGDRWWEHVADVWRERPLQEWPQRPPLIVKSV